MNPTRRDILITTAALAFTPLAGARAADPTAPKPFRVAHLTDMHVQPELRAGEGYAAALASLEKLSPDLIITGGDHVMDATDQELPRAREVWDVFERSMAQSPREVPVRHVLGNHDIFAWGNAEVPESTIGYGRAMALDRLKLDKSYYAFDAGGWKFIVLDSMSRREHGYFGHLGGEQIEWLKSELQATSRDKPIIVFSHIPILAVCVFFDGKRLGEEHWNIPDAWMHADMYPIVELLSSHNVKLAVSGHIHLLDRVEYRGVTYLCDGAVSGNWWKGIHQQCPEGYGVLDLFPDGRFEHRYVTYGWKADKAQA